MKKKTITILGLGLLGVTIIGVTIFKIENFNLKNESLSQSADIIQYVDVAESAIQQGGEISTVGQIGDNTVIKSESARD